MIESSYGGFWQRGVAFLIDKTILFFISLILFFTGILAMSLGFESGGGVLSIETLTKLTSNFVISYYIITALLNVIYFTYFHGTTGQTVGKKIFGLKVVQKTGEPITMGIAFLRWVGYLISALILYLGFIWIAFDRRKQGWHDKIAGTCVIKINPVKNALTNAGRLDRSQMIQK
ncbi:MAG: RDD family protein [Syntrophales bacterium]|nr:RDD family protein [Syntrophales bacterium]